MFKNSVQKGFLTILFAAGSGPLKIWDRLVQHGYVKRVTDQDVKAMAVEICGSNVATCYITTPIDPRQSLGIRLPFMVLIIKNLKRYFSFEVMILDDRKMRRRFRVSNYQSTTKVRPFGCTMPIGLNPGWNQVQFNLSDFTRRAYGSTYMETVRVQVHANCRVRRIFFCDRLYTDEELPAEYKLMFPAMQQQQRPSFNLSDKCEMAQQPPPPSEEDFEQLVDEEDRKLSTDEEILFEEEQQEYEEDAETVMEDERRQVSDYNWSGRVSGADAELLFPEGEDGDVDVEDMAAILDEDMPHTQEGSLLSVFAGEAGESHDEILLNY